MYKCNDCKETFYEPDILHGCYEDDCGVSSQFDSYNYYSIEVCPYCGSSDLRNWDEDYDYEEDECLI